MVASQIQVDYSPLKNICARPQKKEGKGPPTNIFFGSTKKKI